MKVICEILDTKVIHDSINHSQYKIYQQYIHKLFVRENNNTSEELKMKKNKIKNKNKCTDLRYMTTNLMKFNLERRINNTRENKEEIRGNPNIKEKMIANLLFSSQIDLVSDEKERESDTVLNQPQLHQYTNWSNNFNSNSHD